MKKLALGLIILSVVLFIDYFVISLVGIFANLCQAGCGFYENVFGIISSVIIGVSLFLLAFLYSRQVWN